jgi:hypothetical protein
VASSRAVTLKLLQRYDPVTPGPSARRGSRELGGEGVRKIGLSTMKRALACEFRISIFEFRLQPLNQLVTR